MNHPYFFGLLDTPRYHFMMAVIALIVLAVIVSSWVHTHKILARQQRILAALAREVSSIQDAGKASERAVKHIVTGHAA